MADQSYSVRHKRSAYRGFMNLDLYEVTMTRNGRSIDVVREVHDHGHGAAVLPYDEGRRTCLLVRQLRVPVHMAEGHGLFLEAAAGLIDADDESAAHAAVREAAEELGHHVHDLEPVGTFYPMPGMVTEQMHCFLARYTPSDRIAGGGTPDADEVLEVEEWRLADLWRAWREGVLRDGKTIVCLQSLRLARPELFEPVDG